MSCGVLQTVRVRRVFDEKHKTLLYIAYSTRLGGGVSVPTLTPAHVIPCDWSRACFLQ